MSPCPALRAALVAVALLVAGGPAGAAEPDYVEVAPDTPYPPGTRVGLTALGLSFEIPPDWIGRMPAGSEFLFLASHTEPGLVLVTARKATLDEARAFFAQPLPLDAMTVAQPAGAPTVEGSLVRQRYAISTSAGTMTGQAVAKLGQRGGVAFLAFGPDEAAARALADRMLKSVVEHAAPKPGEAPAGPLASALRGRELVYLRNADGFSDEEHVYLCSNGAALLKTNTTSFTNGSVSNTSGVMQGEAQATWTVRGDQVLVMWPDGTTRRWPVSLRGDGSVGVGMDNWWVRPQTVCP